MIPLLTVSKLTVPNPVPPTASGTCAPFTYGEQRRAQRDAGSAAALRASGTSTLTPVFILTAKSAGPRSSTTPILLHGWRDSLCGLLKTIFDNRIPAGHAAFLNSSPYTRFGYSSRDGPAISSSTSF